MRRIRQEGPVAIESDSFENAVKDKAEEEVADVLLPVRARDGETTTLSSLVRDLAQQAQHVVIDV